MPYPGLLPQSPCPCSSPLLTHTSTGDTQTQFCLSLCGVSRSWCTQSLFKPSKRLWQVWGLILNIILPLLLSCWGFSFALGHWLSSRIHSSTVKLPLQYLPSCWGFSALGCGISPQRCVLFIAGDGNAKVGSQEIPGVTGKFGLGMQNEARQRLIEFCQENALVIANTLFQQHKRRLHMDITRWSTPKSD